MKTELDRSRDPFTDREIVANYESWYVTTGNQADRQEKALLKSLLAGYPQARTILEVGCGTGHFTRWFRALGMQPVGLDLSQPMLQKAKELDEVVYLQGNAHMLPFQADSFDLVALITTLEFLSDPLQALSDALRVARCGLVLGVLNRKSRLYHTYKRKGGLIWEVARFFTPDELKRMILEIAEKPTRLAWRTTLWPCWPGSLPLPYGGFIGMAVKN